jgi:FimV-like protein
LFCLVLCLSWFYRRQQTVPAHVVAESAADQGDRVKVTAGTDANAAVDGSGTLQDHMPNVAPELPAEREGKREDEEDRPAGLQATEPVSPMANKESAMATDEPRSPDTSSSLVEHNRAEEDALEALTRDDLSLVSAEALPPEHHGDDSIYGLETDPVDSQLDLARAYIDMGDDESARPVLTQVIEQGSLSQQAEARALLNRLDVS